MVYKELVKWSFSGTKNDMQLYVSSFAFNLKEFNIAFEVKA